MTSAFGGQRSIQLSYGCAAGRTIRRDPGSGKPPASRPFRVSFTGLVVTEETSSAAWGGRHIKTDRHAHKPVNRKNARDRPEKNNVGTLVGVQSGG